MMISIDKYAYMSKIKRTNPIKKLFFALFTLGVCLWANSIIVSITIILIMGLTSIFKGGTPVCVFVKLLTVPMSFLIIGVITIAINSSDSKSSFLCSISVLGMYVGVTLKGIQNAVHLFFKALGAVSCLYYLSLNTPMLDLLSALSKIKVPKLIVEMMGLIYRFIFVLLETANTMVIAQNSRLGYSNLSSGYRSLGALVSTLFIRAYKRSDQLYTALEARGYDGELNVIEEKSLNSNWIEFISPVAINMVLIVLALYIRTFPGGVCW